MEMECLNNVYEINFLYVYSHIKSLIRTKNITFPCFISDTIANMHVELQYSVKESYTFLKVESHISKYSWLI